jgi:hypothetical protein
VACQGAAGEAEQRAADAVAADPHAGAGRREEAAAALVATPCKLPPAFALEAGVGSTLAGGMELGDTGRDRHLLCPRLYLASGGRVAGGSAGSFTRFSGCACERPLGTLGLEVAAGGAAAGVACADAAAELEREWHRTTVLVGVLPCTALLLVGLVLWCGRGGVWCVTIHTPRAAPAVGAARLVAAALAAEQAEGLAEVRF